MIRTLAAGTAALGTALLLSACTIAGDGPMLSSSDLTGDVTTEDRGLEGFTVVHVGGYAGLEVSEGADYSVTVTTDSGLQEHVSTSVDDDTLFISQDYGFFGTPPDVTVEVTVPDLDAVELSGASRAAVRTSGGESLRISSSGAAEIDVHANPTALTLDVSGAGSVTLHGTVGHAEISASGASDVNGEDLTAGDASVDASGASSVSLRVRESLDAKASGASDVRYWGTPRVTSDASGASDIGPASEDD